MNNIATEQDTEEDDLVSNIKILPIDVNFKSATKKHKTTSQRIGYLYFLSWGALALVSVTSLTLVIANEGGISNAVKTASFNKINRQIANNRFGTGDSIVTASIPNKNSKDNVEQTSSIKKTPTIVEDVNFDNLPENSSTIIGTTYFSAYLGQSPDKGALIDLWYTTKNGHADLFAEHRASFYYDKVTDNYKLVVGKFTDLGETLKFCALLKFNNIACQYDVKFVNLNTMMIN